MNNKNKQLPWYFSDLFLSSCFVFWFLYGIPLLLGIILIRIKNNNFQLRPNDFFEEYDSLEDIEIDKKHLLNENVLLSMQLNEELNKRKEKFEQKFHQEELQAEEEITALKEQILNLKAKQKEIDFYINSNQDEALIMATTVDFSENINSNEVKSMIALEKNLEKDLIKSGEAVTIIQSSTATNDKKQSNQLLRAFNAETDYYISNVTARNIDTYRNRVVRSFETLNNLFAIDNVKLSQELLKFKLRQLDLYFEYQKTLENERELLKAQKEEIREQQRVEKEIQDAKRKLEKEEAQFNNEMNKLLQYLNKSNNDIERNIYADKIKELEDKINLLEKDKENILQREQNTRAGFVYIISNIGSFGENVFKIGMTRRLEPLDRISELSGASVPFPFDVHALIFSEDAPGLENLLHHHFREHELNKVNHRKEFFKVDLEKIKELVHSEFNNTVIFTELPDAEQYRESKKIAELIS